MTPGSRDAFLATTARERLRRLVDLADSAGRPWHERSSPLSLAVALGEGWFRDYGR